MTAQPSPLQQKLTDDLKQAMKAGDTEKRSVLRLVMSAIKNAEIAKQKALEDGDVLGIIAKEIRQRKESIEAFKEGKREDLAAKEEAEMAILETYMPAQMSRDEVVAEARKVIAEVGAESIRDKGKVMPKLIANLKGKADGREINEVVTELLS
ncbi:MAG: GatB/YqeY domain-containing protein [Dehalococcoidia bacterium]|jgi:uncharacterized protein YqeY